MNYKNKAKEYAEAIYNGSIDTTIQLILKRPKSIAVEQTAATLRALYEIPAPRRRDDHPCFSEAPGSVRR